MTSTITLYDLMYIMQAFGVNILHGTNIYR